LQASFFIRIDRYIINSSKMKSEIF